MSIQSVITWNAPTYLMTIVKPFLYTDFDNVLLNLPSFDYWPGVTGLQGMLTPYPTSGISRHSFFIFYFFFLDYEIDYGSVSLLFHLFM